MPRYSIVSVSGLAFLLAAASAPQASASGFQLRDQSGSAQGSAYAGVSAGGSDISSMFFNPATLTRFEGNHLQFGLTEIAPSSKFSDGSASRSLGAGAISGAGSTGNIAKSATLPTVYAMWSVNEDLKLGLSVNVPFGLTTEYAADWIGRYHGIKSHLETLDITPTVAYRMNPKWSVGAAFVARRAKAELSQAVDFGYAAFGLINSFPAGTFNAPAGGPGPAPGSADGSVNIQGSSWAYGYKLGLMFDPTPAFHLGLGYQSAIRETLKGTATFSGTSEIQSELGHFGAGNVGNQTASAVISGLAAAAASGSATAVLNLPATTSLGMVYDVSSTFSLAAEVSQTKWSSFKELRVKFSDSRTQKDQFTTENWKDAMFYALGATCKPGNDWTYRLGLALDQTPVPDANRTPRIPDADRTWVSLGVSYEFTKAFGVDAGYSHLFVKTSTVNLQGGAAGSSTFFNGNLQGTYKNSIDILALQARYSF